MKPLPIKNHRRTTGLIGLLILSSLLLIESCTEANFKAIHIGWLYSDENRWQIDGLEAVRLFESQNPQQLVCPSGQRILYRISKYNSAQTPEAAIKQFRFAVNQDRIDLAVTSLISTAAIPIAWDAERLQLPLISAASTNVEISRQLNFVRSISMDDLSMAEIFADYLVKQFNNKKFAIIFNITNPYNRDTAGYFRQALIKRDAQVVFFKGYVPDTSDFESLAEKAKTTGAEVFVLPNFYPEIIQQAKAIKNVLPQAQFVGTDAWPLSQLENEPVLEGSLVLDQWHIEMAHSVKVSADLVTAIERQADIPVSGGLVRAWDALMLTKQVLCQMDNFSSTAFSETLAQTTQFSGVSGEYQYQPDRSLLKPMALLELRDGKFHLRKVLQSQ